MVKNNRTVIMRKNKCGTQGCEMIRDHAKVFLLFEGCTAVFIMLS